MKILEIKKSEDAPSVFMDAEEGFIEIDQLGNKVTVSWYYPEDDEEILDLGEEYEGLVDLSFRHIGYLQEF